MIGKIPTKPRALVSFYYDHDPPIGRLEWRLALTPGAEQHTRVSDQRCELGETFTDAANFGLPETSSVL